MFYDTIQNSDSLKAAADSAGAENSIAGLANNLTFDISKIGTDGIIISVIGYVIVFMALLTLFFFIKNLTKLLHLNLRKKLSAQGRQVEQKDLDIPGEIAAAISTAITLHYQEVHDFENTIVTIKKVQKPYSPWSSKIYGLRQTPLRK
jgi:Na+-transporting methylmalonyl-CoA/oxaloacetate decarboxylase gamma subunit